MSHCSDLRTTSIPDRSRQQKGPGSAAETRVREDEPPTSVLDRLRGTICLLEQELAQTNQEVLALTLELESRVAHRTAELVAAQQDLRRANAGLVQLTTQLEYRVQQRTQELQNANCSLLQEIEERTKTEAELKQANEALRRANKDLEQLAYSASHDLQEPLRMVSIYSQLLRKKYAGRLDLEADQYIEYTIGGAMRMDRLITDLLTYTTLASAPHVIANPVDANEPLRRALFTLRDFVQQHSAVVVSGVLPQLRMKAADLEVVFRNLVENAIKYRGKEPPRIEIAASRQDDGWLISVKDNGIGIEEQYATHIFDLFKRLHTTAEYPGTGMGLAICKRIIERYNGRIWAESQFGKGSTFRFIAH